MNSFNDFQKSISLLEQTQKEIKDAVTAQKAIINNIPHYLEKNLASLRKYFPNLYDKFKSYTLNDNYKLTCTSNGEPNIICPDGHLFYSQNPFSDCKMQVEDYINNFYKWTIISDDNQENNHFNQIHFYYKNKLFSKVADFREKLTEQNIFKRKGNEQIF